MIEIRNATKRYGDTIALNGLSLQIPAGKITVICGPSGSGKTTLLRILAGLEQLDEGEVKGVPEKTVMAFQDGRLIPSASVLHNVMYGLDTRVYSGKEREKRALAAMKLCQCPPRDQKAGTLSGGQVQKTALARAIISCPQLLLLDEPFSSLDGKTRRELQDTLLRIRKDLDLTVILVTHDLAEAWKLGDYLVLLEDGCCVETGNPETVLSHRDFLLFPETEFSGY